MKKLLGKVNNSKIIIISILSYSTAILLYLLAIFMSNDKFGRIGTMFTVVGGAFIVINILFPMCNGISGTSYCNHKRYFMFKINSDHYGNHYCDTCYELDQVANKLTE